MSSLAAFSPAKINFFLAVTGRRADGFHNLVSAAAPLSFGDTLWMKPTGDSEFHLSCDDARLPLDDTNLVLRAARAFRDATGWTSGVRFVLNKRIPVGAGLGGGSSNATAVLSGLNTLAGEILPREQLAGLAAELGSDCALFLAGAPVVMRGRGERISLLPAGAAARLTGRRLLVFKPDFGISTVWAYRKMAAGAPETYLPEIEAEARLGAWIDSADSPAEKLLYNNMERAAFAKYLALPTLLERLTEEFGLGAGMSGSGSACYILLEEKTDPAPIIKRIHHAWSEETFVVEARIR